MLRGSFKSQLMYAAQRTSTAHMTLNLRHVCAFKRKDRYATLLGAECRTLLTSGASLATPSDCN